jgi:glycosyltransferase involved in cell wall biosynthesis
VSRYYGVADVSVVPSDEEVWGLVVNESLASGVPVITTTAVGAARDLVRHDQNGFVVPPGNESALVDILQRVLADDDNRVRLSTNARLTMHDFTYEQNVTAWRAAIAAAVGPRWSERPQR